VPNTKEPQRGEGLHPVRDPRDVGCVPRRTILILIARSRDQVDFTHDLPQLDEIGTDGHTLSVVWLSNNAPAGEARERTRDSRGLFVTPFPFAVKGVMTWCHMPQGEIS